MPLIPLTVAFLLGIAVASRLDLPLFVIIMPVVFSGLYFLVLQLTQGIDWTRHLWLGSVFMAGIVGLFVSMLVVTPLHREASAG